MKLRLLIISILVELAGAALAHDNVPQINSDNSVTFRLYAPNAKKVFLEGSMIPKKRKIKIKSMTILRGQKYKMERVGDEWTYTVQALPSEMYTYRFVVDGKPTLDPKNDRRLRDIADTLNYFFIDGALANYYKEKEIPHGRIEYKWYPSTMNGMSQRRLAVYTPFGYDADKERRYPVLYLLHGSGGDETSWADYGRVCQILDEMIHSKEIAPLVVIMPNGNVALDAAPGESPYMDKNPKAMNLSSMLGKIEEVFPKEVVGYAESSYRIYADKAHRAIAGLSLGGLQTLYIALNNPDMFDAIGLFSPQTTNMLTNKTIGKMEMLDKNLMDFKAIFAILRGDIPSNTNMSSSFEKVKIYSDFETKLDVLYANNPKLLYIAVGEDDFVMKLVNDFRSQLDAKDYPYHYNLTDGAHTWENWRKYLIDFLPRISEKP